MSSFFLHLRRNITRNKGRSVGVILVLGLSLGIFLVLGQVGNSIAANSAQVVASVPNIVTVQSANESIGGGYFHLCIPQCSSSPLDSAVVNSVSGTPNVESVQRVFTQPLHIQTAAGGGFACGSASNPEIMGEDTTSPTKYILGLSGASAVTITSGRDLGPADENTTSAIVSQPYASANSLSVGSSVDVNGTEFEVVGVFSETCYTLILPYPAAAAAMGVTSAQIIYVTVNQYQNVDGVVSSLQSRLGSTYSVQVLANADRVSLQNSISSILSGSEFAQYATLVSGAMVMVVVTVLMNSRRTKEIGILKALGYGNGRIMGRILSESLVIALIALPVAIFLSIAAGPVIAQLLLGHIGTSGLGTPPPGSAIGGSGATANPFLQNLNFALTPGTLILGAEITLAIGVVSAAIPVIDALLLRPAEALRHE